MIALCDTIESKTGVMISLSTIKRLLNGQFARIPQTATLNAIALSAGYTSWRDFKQVKARPEHGRREESPDLAGAKQRPGKPQPGSKPRSNPRILLAGAVLILVLLG
ncbi:MAG TPA: hypothetical protein VL727_17180, partial [Puia sp.]|nr:hypothetical protein [Puia sp.]